MGTFKGKVWGALKKEEQNELLSKANILEEVENVKVGDKIESIIDLTDILSIGGIVLIGEDENEVVINDLAVIYNSVEGVITLQELYNEWRVICEETMKESLIYRTSDCVGDRVMKDFSEYIGLRNIIGFYDMLKLEEEFNRNQK